MVEELIREATKEETKESLLARQWNILSKLAPDILEVAIATISSPAAGLGLAIRKIADDLKVSDAETQKAAEEQFEERVKSFKDEYIPLIESGDLHKAANYLVNEVNRIAEDAVKLNNKTLMNEVLRFYNKSNQKLLTSTTSSPLTAKQLAEFRTELGIVRLKVMWADSQRVAGLKQKIEAESSIKEQLRQLAIKEKALQIRVFLLLLLYIGVITLSIIFGSRIWSNDASIPWLGIPISIVFWSAIGSLANLLYKYYKRKQSTDMDRELKWIWARPLVGIIMGAVTYLVAVSGLILIGAATPQNLNIQLKPEILWLFAFVGGFSDKIFEGVIEKVGLIATTEKNDEEILRNLMEIISGPKNIEMNENKEGN